MSRKAPIQATHAVLDRAGVSPLGGEWPTRVLVLLLFLLLTLGMTYPLVLHLTTAIPGPPWDNFVWLYDLWWFRHSVVDLGQWPTINETIFAPFGYDLRLSETMLANKALIAPVLFWGNEIVAYNVFLILTFVLTGYTTYLLIDYLTDNLYAAFLGAAVFSFCPYRMHAMAAGWLPLLATHWIPLVFLYLERTLREARWQYALALGLFVALTILSSWYYLYIVGSMLLVYLLIRLYPWRMGLRRAHLLRNLALAAFAIVVLVAPVAMPVVMNRSGEMGWPLAEVEKWAASVEDAFLPNVYHPVWGERFLSLRAFTLRYPWYAPGFIYLGILSTVLALAGIVYGRSRFGVIGALAGVGLIAL
ncbi:MAG: hypothetical protein JXA74_12330, partial [Anaerolineae bacterium]|nr:hypothetical protein [Anaerolineae bacterium]